MSPREQQGDGFASQAERQEDSAGEFQGPR